MDIGRAIQYWMSDSDWIKKVLIGGLLFFVPIIGWLIVTGYYIRTIQTISRGPDLPLPEWNQWGDDLIRGLKFFVVAIVWYLPGIAASICAAMLDAFGDGAGTAAGLLLNCLAFIYSLAFTFILPVIVSRFAQQEDITAAFQFGQIIQDAQKVPSQLLIYVVMAFVVGFIAMFGLILCFIGVVFTGFIAYLIQAHLIAQIGGMLGYGSRPTAPTAPPPAVG